VIDAPTAGTTWSVGTTLAFSGSAVDLEDGPLPASALSWDLYMMHCPDHHCHEHIIRSFAGVAGGSFVAPDHEYPSHLELRLTATDSGGKKTTVVLPLEPQTVAQFYRRYLDTLRSLGIPARIRHPKPNEVQNPVRFDADRMHASYDAGATQRFWGALVQADRLLKEFRGRFIGKCSPVHFFWGSFDMACTRFNGRPAPLHPGGIPNLPDWATREAYSHECISAGWWPGNGGGPVREPAFYAYAYPEPAGCPQAEIRPAEASYHPVLREWILPYEAVRRSPSPDALVLDFLESTYETAARLGGWDRATLERKEPARLP